MAGITQLIEAYRVSRELSLVVDQLDEGLPLLRRINTHRPVWLVCIHVMEFLAMLNSISKPAVQIGVKVQIYSLHDVERIVITSRPN